MNKTAILLGTSNQNGNTCALVTSVKDHTFSTVFNLKEHNISPFDYEHENIDDDFIPLILDLLNYDHLIFASPVYWYSMSAQMKIFFDRLSDLLHVKKELGRKLRGKRCSLLATGSTPQPERSFEETFINSFNYLDMQYLGMLYCYCQEKFIHNIHKDHIDAYIQSLEIKFNSN